MQTSTVLVVMAHPDDAELSCGGAVVRWVREGATAVLLIATDGARGGKEPGSESSVVSSQRHEEQREAASILGFSEIVFLGFPDGALREDDDLRGALVREIRRFRPHRVLALDPLTIIDRNSYVNHRDHRVLGMALLDAMYPAASNAGYFPEQLADGLQPYKVPETLLANTERPNFWVDVSNSIDVRFDALRRHRSQIRLWPENGEAIIRQQRETAAVLGLESGSRYAEAYRRIVANPLT